MNGSKLASGQQVQQEHSGSGDNVGRDKVVHNNYLLGSVDYRKLEEELASKRRILDALPEERTAERMDESAGSGWTWLAAILLLEVVLGLLGELMPESVKSAFDALAGRIGMDPVQLWLALLVGTTILLFVLRRRDGRRTRADASAPGGDASRIAFRFGLAAAALLLLALLAHLLPLRQKEDGPRVLQINNGSGDNVARDKIVVERGARR